MNTILLRGGYPPLPIGPAQRTAYRATLERAQLADQPEPFCELLGEQLDATLDGYLRAIEDAASQQA